MIITINNSAMKRINSIFIIFVVIVTDLSATMLTRELNGIRIGDCIEANKITCDYVAAFRDTSMYDFSSCAINEKYQIRCTSYKDTLIAVYENRSVTIIDQRTDTVYSLAYRKPGLNLNFPRPEMIMRYSNGAEVDAEKYFYCDGKDGSLGYVRHAGKSNVRLSSAVTIITPDGDVINDVVPVTYYRTASTIMSHEFPKNRKNEIYDISLSNDSIDRYNKTDSITHIVKHRYWFAPGYRYPIIEARQYKDYFCGNVVDSTYMALYYSQASQESEILNDPQNELIRAELKFKDITNPVAINSRAVLTQSNNLKKKTTQLDDSALSVLPQSGQSELTILEPIGEETCQIYPQIVTHSTTISYTTKAGNDAEIMVFTASGVLQSKNTFQHLDELGTIEIRLDELVPGEYVMVCRIGNNNYTYKIIKK